MNYKRRRMTSSGHGHEYVRVVRSYLDHGIVEFERAWRQFQADIKMADRLTRAFEICWRCGWQTIGP